MQFRLSPRTLQNLGVMRTFPILDSNGEVFAFEIESSYFPTSGAVARFFATCPQVEIAKIRKLFEFGNEIRTEFRVKDIQFEVWEPYGDNSRFWVGPSGENPKRVPEIDSLIDYVNESWPGPISRARAWILGRFGIQA